MREICTSGSMSGEWKRSMAELVRHRQTKEPEIDRLRLNHRATPRLYFQAGGRRACRQRDRADHREARDAFYGAGLAAVAARALTVATSTGTPPCRLLSSAASMKA